MFRSSFLNVLHYAYTRLHQYEEYALSLKAKYGDEETASQICELDQLKRSLAHELFEALHQMIKDERETFKASVKSGRTLPPFLDKLIKDIYK